MNPRFLKSLLHGLILGTVVSVSALIIWSAAALDKWENVSWDWRVSFFAEREKPSEDIVMVLLDQNSLDWVQETLGVGWPWPREIYSSIANFCTRHHSKALAFDVMFTEPSAYGVQDDSRFAEALAGLKNVAGVVSLSRSDGKNKAWPEDIRAPELNLTGKPALLEMMKTGNTVYPYATLPIPEIAGGFSILCNATILPDPDSIYRRIPFFSIFDDKILPIPGLGIYLAANPDADIRVADHLIRIDGRDIPIDRQGRSILRYKGNSDAGKSFSAASVIQSELKLRQGETPVIQDAKAFKDKYVFFGFSAPGLFDHHATPHDNSYPGVAIHAAWLDNFLENQFVKKTSRLFDCGFVFFLCLAAAMTVFLFPEPGQGVAISIAFPIIPVLIGFAAYSKGLWTPVVLPELALGLTIVSGFVINYSTEGKKKRFIKNAFRQYLSPEVIEQLIQDPDKLKLGGERRELSIFFSDIQGFTSISEKLDPEELTRFLNHYLSELTDIIQKEGGTIDKYEGDAIIAFWNAPLAVEDHAIRCVRAALTCQQRLSEMRDDLRKLAGGDVFTRIGINTGFAVVGNMGSKSRFDFTMIGDAVNLAARLESANKQFGTYIMISDITRQKTQTEFAFRTLGRIRVKGRKEPVMIYEPFFHEDYKARQNGLALFEKGLHAFFEGRFEDAVAILSSIAHEDPVAESYLQKSTLMLQTPVRENWEGVWEMQNK
ncbi:MAG: adenylate/guanylate cyclase domain-containing protein [Desulfobacula sp.]